MNRTLRALAIALWIAPLAAAQDDGTTLVYKTKPGETVSWVLTSKGGGLVRVDGAPGSVKPTRIGVDMRVALRTTDRPAKETGALAYDVTLDTLRLDQLQNGVSAGVVEVDKDALKVNGSALPPGPEVDAQTAMYGVPSARFTMPASGHPVEVEDLEDLGPINIGALILLPQPCLPEDAQPRRAGDEWKGKRPFHPGFDFSEKTELECAYELKSVSDGVATIAVTGTWERKDVVGVNEGGIRFRFARVTASVDGSAELDLATGRTLKAQVKLSYELDGRPVDAPESIRMVTSMTADYALVQTDAGESD